jgi:UDP-N-acetyl-D-mannosaminuronate dehydrogenase
VLGLTYREAVKELAYSRGPALVGRLAAEGARVAAHDPLLSDAEIRAIGAEPWAWGTASEARAIVSQTADPRWGGLDAAWFPELALVFDGRNSLQDVALPEGVAYRGVGAGRSRRPATGAARG